MPRRQEVEMAAKDVVEYCPQDEPGRPISTASSVSAVRPLDEIALLKKGCLSRNYERRMTGEQQPITPEELARRGFQNKNYSQPSSSRVTTVSSSSLSGLSQLSLLTNPVIDSAIYEVGQPEERAILKIGKTTRGERYELFLDEVCHAVLDMDPEVKTLVTFRN